MLTTTCSCSRARVRPPEQVGTVAALVFLVIVTAGAAAGFLEQISLSPVTGLICGGAVIVATAFGLCRPGPPPCRHPASSASCVPASACRRKDAGHHRIGGEADAVRKGVSRVA